MFALVVLVLAGCAGSRSVSTEPPRSLAEVNEVLEGRTVQVEFADGSVVLGERATVTSDSVHFLGERSFDSVAVDDVRRITFERDRLTPERGAIGGMAFGGALIALCFLDPESSLYCGVVAGPILMGSALIGAAVGVLEGTGSQERVAYEGPVSRYLRTRD